MDNNGCGFNHFSFTCQPQQNFQQQVLPRINLIPKNIPHQSMPFPMNLAFQAENQRIEIDYFISLHKERLRLILQEQRKQQLELMWRNYETKLQFMLNQKDQEVAKATNRTKELQEIKKKIEIESQTWQKISMENEAAAMSLNSKIQHLREPPSNEDAESCCGERNGEKLICRRCNSHGLCMIFLPCRHLSSCIACDPFLHQCPVCGIAKKASIEAFF